MATTEAQDLSVLRFPALVHVLLGLTLEGAFFIGCIMSMQTTEAWTLSTQDVKMTPDFSILSQFPLFFSGQLDQDHSIAFIAALMTQLVLLVTKIGLAVVHARVARQHEGQPVTEAMRKSAKARMGIWNVLQYIALGVNALSDLVYSWHLGFLQSLFFGGVMFVGTFYFGTWGIQNIAAGMYHENK